MSMLACSVIFYGTERSCKDNLHAYSSCLPPSSKFLSFTRAEYSTSYCSITILFYRNIRSMKYVLEENNVGKWLVDTHIPVPLHTHHILSNTWIPVSFYRSMHNSLEIILSLWFRLIMMMAWRIIFSSYFSILLSTSSSNSFGHIFKWHIQEKYS